jgi:hypothetical protein
VIRKEQKPGKMRFSFTSGAAKCDITGVFTLFVSLFFKAAALSSSAESVPAASSSGIAHEKCRRARDILAIPRGKGYFCTL